MDEHEHLADLMSEVAGGQQDRLRAIIELTDDFCDTHLDAEYKFLCRELALAICEAGLPLGRGKLAGWAAGVVNAVGWVNFLGDPSFEPYMKLGDVAAAFGVSAATMHARSKPIRLALDLSPFDPQWTLPSRLGENPLVWMVEVNGFIADIRSLPYEIQVHAYREGLIPYVPADHEAQNEPVAAPDVLARIDA